MLHVAEKQQSRLGFTPRTWRIVGYVRDVVIISAVVLGAMYFYDHPEAFDAFLYWSIGHYYRH
jgi:hypothetical protein